MMRKLSLLMRRFFLCLACAAAFFVPWPGVWWRWPAAWLFLYASGIGARLKVVPLPWPLYKLVLTVALVSAGERGNHSRLYYHKPDGQFHKGWFLVERESFDKELPALYFVVGFFSARFERDGEGLYLHYRDQYDWRPNVWYEFHNFPRFLVYILSLLISIEYDEVADSVFGEDNGLKELGSSFTTEGRIRVEFPISAGALFFMGVPVVDVTEY